MASTAVINAGLVDVRAGVVVPGQSILIENGRVERVVPSGTTPPLAETIDARGAFVAPGLIDMHVHACGSPDRREGFGGAVGRTTIQAVANLRAALAAGVTTVRDLGGVEAVPYELRAAWGARQFAGSRPIVAGPMLTAIGGHGTERGLGWGREVCGVEEMRRAVRTAVSRGSEAIKVVTSGLAAPTELTVAELKAAVEEAHWNGLKVASHANFGLRGIRNSIAARCDTIEHGCVADTASLERMAERGIALCPTITVLARVTERSDLYGDHTPALTEAVGRAWFQHEETVGRAIELGVPILAGTDAGMPGVGFDALHEELEWLVRWGMSPAEALRAATVTAADSLGREDLGDLRPGCAADLLLLDENPLERIAALRETKGVMLGGRLVSRSPTLQPAAAGAH